MRESLERLFHRCKKDGSGSLVNHKLRGLDKTRLNGLLSIWVIQAKILHSVRQERGESVPVDRPATQASK